MPRPTPLRTVVCGPCWAEHGGQADAAEIGPPPPIALGPRDPRSEKEWLDRLFAENWVALLRVDTRRKLRKLARKLAVHANWDTGETYPTWPRLMAASGWKRSTMAGWLRQLRVLGWLGLVEHGSTPQFRPMALAHVEGNRAAVYVLRIPLRPGELLPAGQDLPTPNATQRLAQPPATGPETPVDQATSDSVGDETWTPTTPVKDLYLKKSCGSSRARDFFHNPVPEPSVSTEVIEALRARLEENEGWTWDENVPTSRAQMLAAACELRRQHPILARLSGKAVRAVCRAYWRAGWTNGDVLHGLAYRPNAWWYTASCPAEQVYAPAGWAARRLSAWRTPTGAVLPGHSAHRAQAQRVAARFGRAALDALPPGAVSFRPEHLLVRARALAGQARETYERRRRRERADELARPRTRAEAACPAGQAAGAAAVQATLDQIRQTALDRARAERGTHRRGGGLLPRRLRGR